MVHRGRFKETCPPVIKQSATMAVHALSLAYQTKRFAQAGKQSTDRAPYSSLAATAVERRTPEQADRRSSPFACRKSRYQQRQCRELIHLRRLKTEY